MIKKANHNKNKTREFGGWSSHQHPQINIHL